MLSMKEFKPRIFEITLSDVAEASVIETLKRDLTPPPDAEGKMRLVLRMDHLDDVTGDALSVETRFEMSMLRQSSKVVRVAVVTDEQVFETLVTWFDPILPMIECRTVASSEAAAARDWARAA